MEDLGQQCCRQHGRLPIRESGDGNAFYNVVLTNAAKLSSKDNILMEDTEQDDKNSKREGGGDGEREWG